MKHYKTFSACADYFVYSAMLKLAFSGARVVLYEQLASGP